MKKGIILAGGTGTRLLPLTTTISKQLLPVYDKPMVHYPLSTLMLAGIEDILVITTERDRGQFEALLGDGSHLGIRLTYAVQASPGGIAQAFLVGEEFVGGDPVCLILGDNIFYGQGLARMLQAAAASTSGATIFSYRVRNPQDYGVVVLDEDDRAVEIVEKPEQPASDRAVTGLYFYDHRVVDVARSLRPSDRGELEITDVNRWYLRDGSLEVQQMSRGIAWFDTGTHDSLLEAGMFMQAIEHRVGLKIGCLEEVAFRMGLIGLCELADLAAAHGDSAYGTYLRRVVAER